MFEDILNKQMVKEFCGSCSTATSGYNPEPLTLEKLQEVMSKLPKLPAKYDTILTPKGIDCKDIDTKYGMTVFTHEMTKTIQTFKPRTRCKRIQKKARKLYTKTVPSNDVFMIDTAAWQREFNIWKPFEWRGL